MSTYHWFILIGCLMLARGLAATTLSRLPVTSAIVYLGVGLFLGPAVLGVFSVDPLKQAKLLEVMTELAVLISLFSAGVKMPVPFSLKRWAPSIRLAWLSMALSVGIMAAFGWLVLGLPVGAAILLGAILAPTDPVLATDVQVRHAGDKDQLRFGLTCEAGMNDGSAFPLVMLGLGLLGLHELGEFGWRWVLVDVLWATSSAVLIGIAGGALLARLGWALRGKDPRHEVLDDLVGLGLIAVVYGLSASLHSWGFLAVFFAGVALRQTELKLAGMPKDKHGLREAIPPSGGGASAGTARAEDGSEIPLTVSGESLIFKEHLERLSELTLVLLLGAAVNTHSWDWRGWGTALFLFVVARPLSVMLGLAGSAARGRVRGITAWFGVRGIGSVYYLMYAVNHGLPPALARDLIDITLVVIMLSIVVHGTSVKPLFDRFWPT
ncbi:cation:proton antiporter [Pseudoduganella namucuonensis]|uniref:Sodium/proton antiporter, CPA1 family n=1 Tax=Pseudoduganella namucuonensis TaxID=1035707 RepID=A0A1I7GTW0_9BURK|nr:cation:proton antiporter [Pseudoduganella namucuonensis]SFU51864.1 sodium/proton antiporter, CPA1 family [Pseudoduganella namucuonensis]